MHQILEPPLTPPWKGENLDFPPSKGGLRGVEICMVCQVYERLKKGGEFSSSPFLRGIEGDHYYFLWCGIVNENVLPSDNLLVAQILPPCCCTIL